MTLLVFFSTTARARFVSTHLRHVPFDGLNGGIITAGSRWPHAAADRGSFISAGKGRGGVTRITK